MNFNMSILSLCVSVISILSVLYFAGVKLGKLEIKVDTMWGFLLKRGAGEGVRAGLMSLDSPIKITNEALAMFESLRPELIAFCKKNCLAMSEPEFAMCIEKNFGERITKEICIPYNLPVAACIIIAVAVAKDVKELHGIFPTA